MSIDWNKAPEGTEAYCEGHWLKRDGDQWMQQPAVSGWLVADFKPWKMNDFTEKKHQFYPASSAEELAEFEAWREIRKTSGK